MKEQIWTGGSSGTTNWHFGDTLNLTNPRISTAAVYAGTELILNNMNKVNNQLVAIFKIERNDKNEITSAKFIKEMWIETKNGSSVDFEVAKDPEISKYKADEIAIRTIYTLLF